MVEAQDDAGSRRNSLLLQQQRNQSHHKQQSMAKPQRQPPMPQRQHKPGPQQQQHHQQQFQHPPQQQQQQNQDEAGASPFSIWTSKPLVTISSLKDARLEAEPGTGNRNARPEDENRFEGEGVEELPEGICVSRFGPISRSKETTAMRRQGSEPRAVTANIGQVGMYTIKHRLNASLAQKFKNPCSHD